MEGLAMSEKWRLGVYLSGGLMALMAAPFATAADYEFSWTGSNNYRLEGAFSISDDLAGSVRIDETDVDCFWIRGFRNNAPIGSWSLRDLTDSTTWTLNFNPSNSQFRVGSNSQEWNMNGAGTGCGENGFGFHAGSYAQDVCINNKLIRPSQILPRTPMTATRNDAIKFSAAECIYIPVS
jgi:hypothetical protein